MRRTIGRWSAAAVMVLLCWVPVLEAADIPWFADDGQRVVLYFFYTDSCPHCQAAAPFIAELEASDWLDVRGYELSSNRDNVLRYQEIAAAIGEQARSVPAFIFCGQLRAGYGTRATTGAALLAELSACRSEPARFLGAPYAAMANSAESAVQLPLLGTIDPGAWGLPVLTVLIALLDAFNPCAFFVLLFLLSLMVHARSRGRMLLVGGTFVLVSGLIYFVFMAAWLNLFLWVGELRLVTLLAGLVAISLATVNIKDYFLFGTGPSLSIPEAQKSSIYQRVRRLVAARNLPAMLAGTVLLAVVVNSYELLCTAGLPMVYTRILTLREADPLGFYLYLGLYNAIYVIPLLVIVGLFVWRFGARKLGVTEGRVLKLLSGLMMLGLGGVMLLAPAALNNPLVALALLGGAVLATVLIHRVSRRGSQEAAT